MIYKEIDTVENPDYRLDFLTVYYSIIKKWKLQLMDFLQRLMFVVNGRCKGRRICKGVDEIAKQKSVLLCALVALSVSLVGCRSESNGTHNDLGNYVQSVITYINEYTPESLTRDEISVCTPNQIVQVYYNSIMRGDNVTYQNIHAYPVEPLDATYTLSNLTTYLCEGNDDFKVFIISFDILDNQGTLFQNVSKATFRCELIRKQDCWLIDCIQLINP